MILKDYNIFRKFFDINLKLLLIVILSFVVLGVKGQSYPTVYFTNMYQGDSTATYATNTQSISLVKLLIGSDFRFVGQIPGATFTASSGNNVNGTLKYTDANGNPFSLNGTISRQDKSGSTIQAYYFYANSNHAYLFILPTFESQYTAPKSVSTSSDFSVSNLNTTLANQATLTSNFLSTCLNSSGPTLTAKISGTVTKYEWYSNSNNAASTSSPAILVATHTTSANTDTYIPSTSSAGTLFYFVKITLSGGVVYTNTQGITINAPPSITSQPSTSSQSICQNGIANALSISASAGSGTGLTFQWYSNLSNSNTGGTLIAGATNSTFSPPTSTVGTIYYYCVVTNSNGCSITSNPSGGITIVSNSLVGGSISGNATVCTGTNTTALTLSGYTSGSSISRWEYSAISDFSSGVSTISNTTTSYTATNLSATTYYRAILSNSGCTFQSSSATVTVNANTAISTQPSSLGQTLCQNATPSAITVIAIGGSLTYQWYSNSSNSNSGGTLISGATNSSYSPSTSTVGTKYYYVIVSGSCGSSVTSNVSGAIIVNTLSATLSISTGSTISCGGTAGLSIGFTGTSPWDFSYTDGTNSTTVYSNATNPYTFNVSPSSTTTYSLTSLVDGNFCSSTPNSNVTVTVTLPIAPTATITQPTCSVTTGSVSVTSSTTGLTFTLRNQSNIYTNTTGVFNNIPSGSYSLTSTSISGCNSSALNITINAQPATPTAPVIGTITQPTCSVSTGSVALSGLPSSGTWTVTTRTGSIVGSNTSTAIFSNLIAGTYTFTVTNGSCTSVASSSITINAQPATPTAPVIGTITQPTCSISTGSVALSGLPSGSWTITVTGGATITGSSTTAVFSNLSASTYTFTVSNGSCTSVASSSITINTQPATPTAPVIGTITQPTCSTSTGSVALSGLPSGSWTITATGGATITGSSTTAVFSNLSAGTYTFTVTNGSCTSVASSSIIINAQPATPTAPLIGTITQPTCSTSTGSVALSGLPSGSWTVTATGGATITGSSTTAVFSNLSAGTYTFTVSNGSCTSFASSSITINTQPATPTAPVIGTITQPTCSISTGSVALSGLPYSGTWTVTTRTGSIVGSNTSTAIFSNLSAGTYTFTVTNGSCTSVASSSITINAQPATPTAPVVGTITQPTCSTSTGSVALSGLPSGSWTVTATGGATITGSSSTAIFSNLSAGTYTFTVSNGSCTSVASSSITINAQPATPTAPVATIVQPNCTIATGTISVTSNTNNLIFSLDGLSYSNSLGLFNTVNPGTYNLTSKNSDGCVSSATVVVINNQPPTPTIHLTSVPDITTSETNFNIYFDNVSSNTYNYSLNSTTFIGSYSSTGSFTPTDLLISIPISNTTVGTYSFTLSISNTNGCVSANNSFNLKIGNIDGGTIGFYSGGIYTHDQKICFGANLTNSTISSEVDANGGATTLSYKWYFSNDGSMNAIYSEIQGANSSTYTISNTLTQTTYYRRDATDGSSIASSNIITVEVIQLPTTPTASVTDPTCTISTGAISVTSGISGLTFSLNNGSSTITNTTGVFNNLSSGNYSLTSTNASGCESAVTALTIAAQPTPQAIPTITLGGSTTFCSGGSVLLTATSATSYLWNNGATTQSITATTSGLYSVTVTNSSGCSATSSVITVTVNALPTTPTASVTDPTCTISTGAISVTSGISGLTFSLNNGSSTITNTTGVFNNLSSGNYSLTSTNASGCESAVTALTIATQPVTTSPSVITGATSVCVSSITTLSSSGTWSSSSWSSGNIGVATINSSNGQVTGVSYGTSLITYTVTNASGCSSSTSTTVTVNALPATPTASVTNPTCTTSTGTISVTSGISGLTFNLNNGSSTITNTTGVFNNLSSGNYSLTSTNASGCESAVTALTIAAQPTPQATPTITSGGSTTFCTGGSVSLSATSGNIYLWNNGATTQSITATISGSYSVTVTNSSGCSATSSVTTVTVNALPTTPSLTATNNCGNTVLTTTATGTLLWSTGATSSTITVTTAGTYTLTQTSGGCTSGVASATASPLIIPSVNIGSISNVNNTATIFNLPYTVTTGTPTQYLIVTGTPAMSGFTLVSYSTLTSSPIAVSIPTSAANTYGFTILFKTADGCTSSNNFNLAVIDPSFGVSTIVATGTTTFTYNATAQGPTTSTVTGSTGAVTYSYSGTGSTTYGPSATLPTAAGTYQVIASVAGDANYNGASSVAYKFTINKAASTIVATGTTTYTYNATAQGPTTSIVTGSTGAVTYSYSGTGTTTYGPSATLPTAAGTYQVIASVAGDANYNWANSSPYAFVINQVVPSIGNSTIVINGPNTYTYSGASQGPSTSTVTGSTGTISYSYSGTGSSNYGPSSTPPKLPGTYQVIASVSSDANYYGATSLPFAFTITQVVSTPIATNAIYILNQSNIPNSVGVLVKSYPVGTIPVWCRVDSLVCSSTPPTTPTVIGTYVYQIRSYDTTTLLYSNNFINDTVVIVPPKPITLDSTYVIGVKNNPLNVGVQVSGLTNATFNYYYANNKMANVPSLGNVVGTTKYTVSQVVNSIESDTSSFSVTMLDPTNIIHLQKIVDSGILQVNSTFNYPFTFLVSNLTKYPFTNVTITDNLNNSVPITSDFSIVKNNATGGLQANTSFNGSTDNKVTNSMSTLAAFAKDTSKFVMNLAPKGYTGTLSNVAYVTADTKWGTVTMQSSSETKATEIAKLPTTYFVKDLRIYIPEGFSPNHDGVHDTFVIIRPYGVTLDLVVFNRWGNEVYSSTSYQNDWDGRGTGNFAGQDLIDGGYYYSLKAVDETGKVQVFKGSIIIQR